MMDESKLAKDPSELTWVARLPFARDPVFIRQMTLVFVLPLVVLGLLLVIISWPLDMESVGLVLRIVLVTGAVLLALYVFVIFGVLRGRQEIRYTLDEQGIREETAGPLKYMNIVKFLLLLSGKPTYAGIGLMAQGPKSEHVIWKRVQEAVPDPQARTITLRKGRADVMVLHCTEENYEQVLARVQAHAGR
jgi:hypothetical protein